MSDVTEVAFTIRTKHVHAIDLLLRELLERNPGMTAGEAIMHVIACATAQILGRGRAEGLSLDDALEDVDAFLQGGRDAGIQVALRSPFAEGWK